MRLSIIFLFAMSILAQTPQTTPTVIPTAKPSPEKTQPAKPVVDKDLYTIYESYGVKMELVQRRAEKSVEELKKNVDATITELQKQQETARLKVCAAAKLPDTCAVSQDPKTGEWSAGEKPEPATPKKP